jgi:hypothetical protein
MAIDRLGMQSLVHKKIDIIGNIFCGSRFNRNTEPPDIMLQHVDIIFHRVQRIIFPFEMAAEIDYRVSNVHLFHPAQ